MNATVHPRLNGLTDTHDPELASLARERDPELFEQGLFHYASRLEAQGKDALASRVYAGVQGGLADKARLRSKAINGGGSFGARVEILLRHLCREALDPAALAGLGGAAAVFRVARLGALGRLAVASPKFLTRGLGARRLAGLLGYGAEALAFPFFTRLAGRALGRPFAGGAQLSMDIGSSFLTLGALRLAGTAGPKVVPRQASMLAGLFATHRLEEKLGWRPSAGADIALADSLAMLFQFQLAGRVARAALGEAWAGKGAELDLRSAGAAIPELRLSLPGRDLAVAKGPRTLWSENGGGPQKAPSPLLTSGSGSKAPPTAEEAKATAEASIAEFKTEARHLAHDMAGSMTSLLYSLPMLREWLHELNSIQSELIRHYRFGSDDPPPELSGRLDALHRIACQNVQPKMLSDGPPDPTLARMEQQILEVRGRLNHLMDILQRRVDELIDMTNEFRNMAALDGGYAPTRLDRVLEEHFLRGHLGASTQLSFHVPEKIFVPGPHTTLRRVFQNLLVNARESLQGRPEPRVILTVGNLGLNEEFLRDRLLPEHGFAPQAGVFWMVRIQDNGAGMSPSSLSRIFETGYSSKPSRPDLKRPEVQRGLGLAQVHAAIRDRGGFIRVESDLGLGTTFEVYLPDSLHLETK